MNYYSIALFLHIVGAIGFFIALALEWMGLRQMRNARTFDQVREWMDILKRVRGVGMFSMLLLLVAGFYMMVTAWGLVAWIGVALVAIFLSIGLTMTLTGPRMMAIGKALVGEYGPVSSNFQSLVRDPFLWVSIQTRVTIGLGIVFLMTVKPAFVGSVLVIVIAVIFGLAFVLLPMLRQGHVQARSTD